MKTAELKNRLHKLIAETDDIEVLTKIQTYFSRLKSQNEDWWDGLSESDKKSINEGLRQADNENFIEDSEARKSINDFLKDNV